VLPDFPEQKRRFYDRVIRPVMRSAENAASGPFAQSPHYRLWEGGPSAKTRLTREDGSVEVSRARRTEVKVEIDLRELESIDPAGLVTKVRSVADEMGRKMFKQHLSIVQRTIEKTGRGVNAEGPLTVELLLKMLGGMHIEFDGKGNPELPTMMMHPTVREVAEARTGEMLRDNRYADLIDRKRLEWREREASRKLVG